MIADLEKFKLERAEAIKSRDIETIKAFFAKYGIKTNQSDSEILLWVEKMPAWH